MTKKRIVYLFVLVLLNVGCLNHKETSFEAPKRNLSIDGEKPLIANFTIELEKIIDCKEPFFVNFSYIPLQSSEDLIAEPEYLIVSNNYYIIQDRYTTMGVFVFNKQGKFLYAINAMGKGPGFGESGFFLGVGDGVDLL